MVLAVARALIINGPMTQQERWKELEGYSPSTLASNIAALRAATLPIAATKYTRHPQANHRHGYVEESA
ncbi:hypothetical protein BH160DRAFT_5305 [Burkholderia sp. H160]|nr:hypothetical protein BH160DRAFT_5305 [Burkholderia sp. H160]